MKKITLFFLVLILLCSCEREEKFVPPSGEYILECKIEDVTYLLTLELSEDLSGNVRFNGGAMSDWSYQRSPDGKIKCFTSLQNEIEVKQDIIETIFDFVTLSEDALDAYHENADGKDVSVLKLANGSKVYTDSQSGAPIRMEKGNMTCEIISRP